MTKKLSRSAAVMAVAGLALSLTACSGSDQSVQEACDIALPKLASIESEIDPNSADYDATSKADRDEFMAPILEEIQAIPDTVDNTEVKSAFQDYSNIMQATSDLMEEFDIGSLEPGSTEATEKQAELNEALGERSESLMNVIENINTLCGPA